MRTPLSALVVASTISWSFVPLAQAQDASPPATDAPIIDAPTGTVRVVRVDETLKPKAREALRVEVERVLGELATTHGLTIVESEQADILVRFEVSHPQADAPLFIVQAIAKIGDEAVRGEARTCLRCSTADLVAQGFEIFPAAVAKLEERWAAEAAAQAIAAVEPEPAPTPAPVGPKLAPLGPAGYVGIASSGLGLVSAIVGGVWMTRAPKYGTPGLAVAEFIDYRPPGIALLGVGLGMLVVGNVLLAVDLGPLAERRRARVSHQAQLTGIGMTIGPIINTVVLEGRF